MVTTPIISFTADVSEPDLYNDLCELPNPFTLNILLGITNTHPSTTLYFKASIVTPPGDYSVSSTNLGSLAPGLSGFFTFTPTRAKPTLTAGEFDETLTLKIDAYTDSGYSAAYANQTLSTNVHHFDHTDASWTIVEHATFASDLGGWTHIGGYGNPIDPTHFYSSPASMRMSYVSIGGGQSYGPGTATKTLNTGAKTKARLIFHIYQDENADDDAIQLTIGGIVKKPRALPLPTNMWIRIAYNFPVNTNVETEFWCRGATNDYPYYWIDEIWVISK